MPQHSLHPLVYILLMWITIISIIQVVFITFFFTMGQNGQSLSRRAEEPSGTHEPLILLPSTAMPVTKNNVMVTYEARQATEKETIKWIAKISQPHVISESGETLLIKKDGFYFLSLQVTLNDPCDKKQNHTVRLERRDKVLLEGWIHNGRRSSGQLSKVEGLPAQCELKVTIHPPTSCINETSAVTHLDIIFMK